MKTYEDIKKELKRRKENTAYFTPSFYQLYTGTYNAIETGSASADPWEPVRNTEFYNKNSCAYCEFLSVFIEMNTKKYYFNLYTFDAPGILYDRKNGYFLSDKNAYRYAMNHYNNKYMYTVEVA